MDYFPHDTKALSDDKLLALRIKHGGEAVYCYWSILEKIYADERPFCISETNMEAMSVLYRLGFGFDTLKKYVETMLELGLLYAIDDDGSTVMSRRAEAQIEQLEAKRETARQNGKKRLPKKVKKQGKTNVASKVGSEEKPNSDTYKTKTENAIGSYKKNQIASADGAGAEKPAPSAQDQGEEFIPCPDHLRPIGGAA